MSVPVDVLGYLHAKGVATKRAGADEVHVACFYCGEDDRKRGRLYINVSPDEQVAGLHMCHLCGTKGNLRTLKGWFGDKVDNEADDTNFLQHRILQVAADFYHGRLDAPSGRYLQEERGLSIETIDRHKLGFAEGGNTLYRHLKDQGYKPQDILATGLCQEREGRIRDFFQNQITLPYHVAGNVVMLRGKEIGGKYLTPPGNRTRLFNTDVVWGAEEVVICEGEFDAMVLEQLGYAAIGCPGANTWQDSFTSYFADTRRVFLVFDPDEAGEKGAAKVKDAIGIRAKIVELPVPEGAAPKTIDPSSLVVDHGFTKQSFEALFGTALTANSLLRTPAEAEEEWLGLQGVSGLKLGYEELDKMIAPGVLPAQVVVVLAKTNTGKTIHLLNTFQRLAMAQPDAKILFLSLEQTRGDWFERARRIWNFYNLDADPREVNQRTKEFWTPRLRIVDKNRLTEDELLSAIDDFTEQMGVGPDLVAIDYLGYWSHAFSAKDRYTKTTDAIMSLKAVAKEKRTAIIVPHQVNRLAEFGTEPDVDSARDSGAVEETADFVFTLWSPDSMKGKNPDEKTGEVCLRIGKSRHGGKGAIVRMQFSPLSLTMVPKYETATARLAVDELGYLNNGDTWERAIFRHRTGVKKIDAPKEADYRRYAS